ncbi:protein GET1 [Kockovaella imperatae]|uniref:Protein GET1 n=1 Tax=Kockovaella imperatae TaxID=4999 RepID=A0A1Y1UK15_9TREE|nr:protein GET1 [Kockovaella imperatae]ORX38322.1 protein GET1 [Kockovaella imperatae]
MANLALLIFLVVLLTQVVSWVGKSVLQELAFSLYSRLFLTSAAKKQRSLRKQVLDDKAELGRTSSQDEFAKWAKIKRRLDKSLADLEKSNSTLASARTKFTVQFSSLIWICTTGAQLVLVWWFRKRPVFWLPRGWIPGPIVWLLSFPSAPLGAVSSGAWAAVCKRVFATVEEIVKALMAPSPAPVPMANQAGPQSSRPTATIEPIELEHEKVD